MKKKLDNKIKVLLIFGTRPEVIKMAPIYWELEKNSEFFKTAICITSQHKSLISKLINSLGIKADFDLRIMKKNQKLSDLTSALLKSINIVIEETKPDIVLVQGDTISAFAGALCAFYNNIKICHIEAGLRSFDMKAPFPEEFCRKSISSISYLNFSPTNLNKTNLINEGILKKNIYVTGNTVIDCLFEVLDLYKRNKHINNTINRTLDNKISFNWRSDKFILITGHRRENIGPAFEKIMMALSFIAKKNNNIKFVYPIHPNPLVRNTFGKITKKLNNFFIIEPLEYIEFSILMSKCFFLMTDSGGIQEEAPSLGKPVLLMREKTERIEGVHEGVVKLVGSNIKTITKEANLLISNENEYIKMSKKHNPYGNGKAAKKIIKILKDKFL